jgi:hypothetical protein
MTSSCVLCVVTHVVVLSRRPRAASTRVAGDEARRGAAAGMLATPGALCVRRSGVDETCVRRSCCSCRTST